MAQINAFDNLTPIQPAQPINWDFLQKAKDAQDARKLKLMDIEAEAESGLPLNGGFATRQAAQEFNNTYLQPALSSFRDRLVKNEDPIKVYGDLKAFSTRIQKDPRYQAIKADEAYRPEAAKLVKDPLFDKHIQDFYTDDNGFNQLSLNNLPNFTPETYYKSIAPGDQFADFKPFYDKVVAQETKEYDPTQYTKYYDENGNYVIKTRTDGRTVKTITPDQMYNIGRRLAYNPDSGFMDLPSMRYLTAKLKRDTEDTQNPVEAAARAFRDSYPGYYRTYLEMQPKESRQVIKAPTGKGSSSSGSGNQDDSGLPNEVSKAINDLGIMDKDGNISGEATVRPEVLAPMLGGKTKDGKMTLDIDAESNPVFLAIPKISSDSKSTEEFSLAKALPYKASYEQAKEELKSMIEDININSVRNINSQDGTQFKLLANNMIGVKTSKDPFIGYNFKITLDQFIKDYLPTTELADSPVASQLEQLNTSAKEKFNLDLTDPSIQDKINKFNKNPKARLYQELATTMSNLTGSYEFHTDAGSKNLFLDDQGTPVGKGFIIMNGQELSQIFPNFEKALKENIIKPAGFERVITDNGTSVNMPKYKIPIYKQTAADITNVTQSYVDAAYGSRKDVDDVRSKMIEQSKNSFDELNIKKGFIAFSKTLKDQKSIESYIQKLNQNAKDLASLDQNASLKAMNTLNDIHTLYKDKSVELKKQLFLFNLGLAAKKAKLQTGNPNPPELIMFNKASQALR